MSQPGYRFDYRGRKQMPVLQVLEHYEADDDYGWGTSGHILKRWRDATPAEAERLLIRAEVTE